MKIKIEFEKDISKKVLIDLAVAIGVWILGFLYFLLIYDIQWGAISRHTGHQVFPWISALQGACMLSSAFLLGASIWHTVLQSKKWLIVQVIFSATFAKFYLLRSPLRLEEATAVIAFGIVVLIVALLATLITYFIIAQKASKH